MTLHGTNRWGLKSRVFLGVEVGLGCLQNVGGLSAACRMDASPTACLSATKHRQQVRYPGAMHTTEASFLSLKA